MMASCGYVGNDFAAASDDNLAAEKGLIQTDTVIGTQSYLLKTVDVSAS